MLEAFVAHTLNCFYIFARIFADVPAKLEGKETSEREKTRTYNQGWVEVNF